MDFMKRKLTVQFISGREWVDSVEGRTQKSISCEPFLDSFYTFSTHPVVIV